MRNDAREEPAVTLGKTVTIRRAKKISVTGEFGHWEEKRGVQTPPDGTHAMEGNLPKFLNTRAIWKSA